MSTILQAGNATSGAVVSSDTAGSLQIQTGSTPTTAVTVDASQNVGIGTASPTDKLNVFTAATGTTAGSNVVARFSSNGSGYDANITMGDNVNASTRLGYLSGNMYFWTSGAERMRIDSSGNLLVGTTTNTTNTKETLSYDGNSFNGMGIIDSTGTTAGTRYAMFFQRGTGTTVGSISTTTSATAYNTSSDYRLKENVAPMTGALETVAQLKPVTYDWILDKSKGQGFIAHELQAVVPDCVTGEKDAVDAEGNPVYQGIDTSFLVATLTAAIQELNAKVTALEAQLGVK
jgi:hypothetical protein